MPAFAVRHHRPPAERGGALDALASGIDLGRLSPEQFEQLIKALHMLGESGSGVELSSLSTESFVNLVARASKDQLKRITEDTELRTFFLEEIFRRMSDHLIESKSRGVSLTLSWRFTDGDDADEGGEYQRYQTVIEDGVCVSGEDLGRVPDTTLTMSALDFMRVATGNAAVAPMFITGRVRVKGDYSLAAMLSSYFDIPKPTVKG
ncbi:alkyl sulfatase C-terminal domain-containing protein [Haloechinothrix sp. LS1_15]|uniref:SCP2 sterol-binding domain-containing protein n=1 Tax=Haloechinothrix sp. LS1_15 TaxID=2652248 RepID=UPI00294407D3|nr:SCP2 sterol-binding domain-containing protein [Haloechinothrix sp. LS1_15]MDV6011053.1 sterol-binding protein [Haloechinothrix sp. LS1_15]